jgi:hypothetical protein
MPSIVAVDAKPPLRMDIRVAEIYIYLPNIPVESTAIFESKFDLPIYQKVNSDVYGNGRGMMNDAILPLAAACIKVDTSAI